MNIKFRDLPEYKALCEDIKRVSLKLKNKNIHNSCVLRNLRKQFPRLAIIDDIVKKYYNENSQRLAEDHDDKIDVISEIMKLVRKVIPVSEIAFKPVNEYVRTAYARYTNRISFKKKYTYVKNSIKDMLKNRVRSSKIHDEKERNTKETRANIGIYNFMKIYCLNTLSKIVSGKLQKVFSYFCDDKESEDYFNEGGLFTDYHARSIAGVIDCPMLLSHE